MTRQPKSVKRSLQCDVRFAVLALAAIVLDLSVPALLAAAENASATRLGVSDSPPVVPVLSPPLKDIPPLFRKGVDQQKRVINLPLPHPGWPGDRAVLPDGAVQGKPGITAPTPTGTNFQGLGATNAAPPDNDGAVGPNHYVQWINLQFAIYDKTGTKLYGPADGNTLFTALGPNNPCVSHNDGDPIVEYDQLGDRWVLTQLVVGSLPNFSHQCIAISVTGDPLGAYYLYDFITDPVNFVDYPHLAVWPDSYYMTAHIFDDFGTVYLGQGLYAFERPKMLVGLPARVQGANVGGGLYGGALPSDLDGLTPSPAVSPNYMIAPGSPELDGSASDVLHIWKASASWGVTPTFTITGPTDVATAPFRADLCGFSQDCIPQPGTTQALDAISDRLMWRLAYRNMGGTESLVMNHTVDVSTPPANQAGIRWYEVRSPGSSPTIFQQGTFAPDPLHRWMGSIAMDNSGDMALGYSKSSNAIFPEIDITGRLAGDPLGTMGAEIVMKAGAGSQTGLNRWGDYTAMTVDPRDGCTFWYTNQYQPSTGSFNWNTRIASFRFPSCVSQASGTIQGLVTGPSGNPIVGALVSVDNGFSGTTDASGRYSIVLPPGSYLVTATAPQDNCNPSASQPTAVVNGGVVTLNFTLTGSPLLAAGTVGIDDSLGNNNGVIDRNECVRLNLPLQNMGCAPATGISAVLSTSTPGVAVTQPNSTYPNLPLASSALNNTPFQIATSPSFVCGTPINFTLAVTFSTGTTPLSFVVPTCPLFTEFPVPTAASYPFDITAGPDGNLWFTENVFVGVGKIGRITTAGTVAEFTVPTANGAPFGIAAGPDGNLWFTESQSNKIGRITTAGVVTEFPIPTPVSFPQGIAAGPDGNLWFAEYISNKIGRITTAGVVTEFAIPTVNGTPFFVAAGPDGNLWFTESQSNKIGRITTAGVVTEFPIPTSSSVPFGIVAGPDGNLWFTEQTANQIGRITTTGVITEFSIPTAGTLPEGIARGPDGNIWFTEARGNKIGRITTAGAVTEFAIPTAASFPGGIVAGPDGALWFTESASTAPKIGRINVSPAVRYYTVTPCRLIDTRENQTPALFANDTRTFVISGNCSMSSTCSIPSTAVAVAANLTVVSPTAAGHLTVYPSGADRPGTSVINYLPGQTRANNAIITLIPGGGMNVFCAQASGTVDFVFDIVGYFQ